MEIRIINGFIWAVIDEETAQNIFESAEQEIFKIYVNEEAESLCEEEEDLVTDGLTTVLGIEIGQEEELKSTWQEECARNNEKRSLDSWIEDKAESLIN